MKARFDHNDHATVAGWATYHRRRNFKRSWRLLICLVKGHSTPSVPPTPNGYSPNCFGRCERCQNFLQWFVVGQHRYGGYNRDTHESYLRAAGKEG